MKKILIMLAMVFGGCSATVPLADYTKLQNELAKLQEEKDAQTVEHRENVAVGTMVLSTWASQFTKAIANKLNVPVTVTVDQFSFAEDHQVMVAYAQITTPEVFATAYAFFVKSDNEWVFVHITWLDLIKTKEDPEDGQELR